jgi:hypothetical protein
MFRCSYLAVILGFGLCWGCAVAAGPKKSERENVLYEYAHNKVGLLRYCRRNGLVGSFEAERAAQDIEVGLPDLDVDDRDVRERGDKAEKMGEAGFWDAEGREDLASAARRFNTTPSSLCAQLAGMEAPAGQSIFTIKVDPKPPASSGPAPEAKPQRAPARTRTWRSPKSQARNPASPVKKPPQLARAKPNLPAAAPASPYLSPADANKWLHDRHARPWGR